MALKLCIPQRFVFAVMGFLITLVAYMMRISLDVAMSSMVNETVTAPLQYDPSYCLDIDVLTNQTDVATTDNLNPGTFDWSSSTQNSVSAVFRSSYIITQFIGGMLADRSGGRKVMGVSLTLLSLATFLIPFASKLIGSNALYVLRFLSGMASGVFIPTLLSMMSKWIPKDEQALIGSIIFPGSLLGYVIGSLLGDLIVTKIGWEALFYMYGGLGAVCCSLWMGLVYSNPNEHPAISESEKRYLNKHLPSLQRTTKYELDPLPWTPFLRSGALWGTVMGYVGREWAFAVFTVQLPQFMKEVLRFDITISPFFVYMPYVLMWLAALLFGISCDILIKKKICSVKTARKIFTNIGTIGAIICIITAMYSGCDRILAVFWLFSGMIALGSFYSGCMIGALDITPNYAGTMIGVIDNISINTALLLPSINGILITDALIRQWRLSFWLVVFLLLVCIAVYIYYAQGEQLWWDDVRTNGYPDTWKRGLLPCEGKIDENGKSIFKENEKLNESSNDMT